MTLIIRLIFESFRFAIGALRENLLRTTLSLLGVTVGIFSIISVLTIVDALDSSIKKSFSFLGDKVIYVQKWPMSFGEGEYAWWEYIKRPQPTMKDFEFLDGKARWADALSVFDVKGGLTISYKGNSMASVSAMGITYEHNRVIDINIEKGRYFSRQETAIGRNVVIIGQTVAEELFGSLDPVGREIKIKGRKFIVIGLLEKQGENFLPTPSYDDLCIIPFSNLNKLFASSGRGVNPTIAAKGFEEDEGLENLQYELQGLMRSVRRLKPMEKDNFALNKTESLANFINTVTGALKVAGWFIGSFALLVGGFGIANIMFVSVKERTSIIGIQKSLGAKGYFILFQFLFEAVFLSFFGGSAGLLLVSGLSLFSTDTFIITLSFSNIMIGLVVSSVIGILSGFIPALSASKMDPVIAIRS